MKKVFGIAAVTGAVCLVLTMSLRAQAPARPPLAEEVFKNIQVFRGMPVDQFMTVMGFFSTSVGLNCTDCHVEESGGSWARYADDNGLKQTSRRMVLMMDAINKANFGGRQVVTCNTCHRGVSRPNVMPSLDALYGAPPPDEPGDPVRQVQGQPRAEQVLDAYLAAIGGPQRVAALTSFVGKGTYLGFDDADDVPLDVYARASGQRATVVHGVAGETTTVVNGANAWIAAPPTDKPVPLLTITGQEMTGLRLETDLWFPTRIKELLTNWRVGAPAELGGREVRVLQGDMPGGGVATLCFDNETGLLVRFVRFAESPVGRLVTRVDYGDYKEVAGVRVPHRWTVSWLSGRSVYTLANVQPNVAIPDARFTRPAR